jgi:hypothetical protein
VVSGRQKGPLFVYMRVGAGVSVAHLVSSASPGDFRSILVVTDLDTRSQRHVPRIAATNPTFRSLTRDYGKRVRETPAPARPICSRSTSSNKTRPLLT